MDAEQFAIAKSLFHRLRELSEPEQRVLLDAQCAVDSEIRKTVERMVLLESQNAAALETPDAVRAFLGGIGADPDRLPRSTDTEPDRILAGCPDRLPRVLGNYELLEKIGGGGYGVVYRARHRRFADRIFAVKLVRPDIADERTIARFEREIRAISELRHPNLVYAFDAGQWNHQVYLVTEYIAGIDLQKLIAPERPISLADVCEMIRQTAIGLQHAHDHGITHRDIKPANLMLSQDGTVKILDLGLARLENGKSDASLTYRGDILGTLDYMAPEQWDQPDRVGPRSDIYSLGCTLYCLLAGTPPFFRHGESPIVKMRRHGHEQPRDIRQIRPDVPGEIASLIVHTLRKDPTERIATCTQVADAVAPFVHTSRLAELCQSYWSGTCSPGQPVDAHTQNKVRESNDPDTKSPPPMDRRFLLKVTFAGIALLSLPLVLTLWPEPLIAPELNVERYRRTDTNILERVGVVGIDTQQCFHGDLVRVSAKLKYRAYCLLLTFNPTNDPESQIQICWPADGDDRLSAVHQIEFPKTATSYFTVTDGVGQQVFALIVSRRPFPPFQELRQSKLTGLPWSCNIQSGIWRFDGHEVKQIFKNRGDVTSASPHDFERLMRELTRRFPDSTVSGFAFPVEPQSSSLERPRLAFQ